MPTEQKQSKLPRELIMDPAARIRQLSDHGSSVEIDKAIPIKRYYRSGSEMERQVGSHLLLLVLVLDGNLYSLFSRHVYTTLRDSLIEPSFSITNLPREFIRVHSLVHAPRRVGFT